MKKTRLCIVSHDRQNPKMVPNISHTLMEKTCLIHGTLHMVAFTHMIDYVIWHS